MSILTMFQGVEDHINGTVVEEPGSTGGAVTEATEVALEEVRADVAESVAEVEQLAEAVAEVQEELKEHEETVEELTEEVGGLEALLSAGQFSSTAFAQKYNRALSLNAKLGGKNFSTLGAESISDAATARLASVTGVEGFMDTLKAGASKAIEYIKHIFNTVINFFVGMVSAASGLARRKEMLSGYLDKKQVKEEVKLGGWNVGCDYEAEGVDGIGKLLLSSAFDITHDSLPKFMDLGKNLDGVNVSAFKTAYNALIGDIKGVAKDAGKTSEKATGDKHTVLGTHAGFRIFAVFDEKIEKDEDCIKAARSIKISFGKTEEAKKFADGKSVKVKATSTQLKGLLKSVDDYVTEIRSSKVQQKFSKSERDRVIGTLNVASKSNSDKKADNDKAIALCKAIFVSSSALTTTMTKLYVYLAKQIMDAVQAHI